MRDYSKAIELAIPDNLRLGTHSDAKLINSLIARLVVCSEENDSVWQKNRMACWNETIARWNEEEFIPHITKEDEDWNSLKTQIAANEAELASHREVAAIYKDPEVYRRQILSLEAKLSKLRAWEKEDIAKGRDPRETGNAQGVEEVSAELAQVKAEAPAEALPLVLKLPE